MFTDFIIGQQTQTYGHMTKKISGVSIMMTLIQWQCCKKPQSATLKAAENSLPANIVTHDWVKYRTCYAKNTHSLLDCFDYRCCFWISGWWCNVPTTQSAINDKRLTHYPMNSGSKKTVKALRLPQNASHQVLAVEAVEIDWLSRQEDLITRRLSIQQSI